MGQLLSGGTSRPATEHDLESYDRMRQQQAKQPVPVLQHHDNPHEYLFIALFDGTGQNVDDPMQLPTNIGDLQMQAKRFKKSDRRVGYSYVEGIGTQRNPVTRLIDGATAYTWDDKIQAMYSDLADKTREWIEQDPQAKVRLAEVGYSRGAVLVPGFARLVDQYGIVDPKGMKFGRDAHGNLTVKSPHTLIPPGQIAQAVGLFDPVGTNMPRNYDARLPKSVLSGFSQIARDEQRELFPHQTILDPDWSDDGRFLSAAVPGGHSNVGGGNREAGLEVQAFNGMADYLNSLTDRPLFEHRPVPADPTQYTIFQAQGATAAFGLRMDDDGQRDLRDELANCKIVDMCHDAEPVDMTLARQFEWQRVRTLAEPVPTLPEPAKRVSFPYESMSKVDLESDRIMEDYFAAMDAGDEPGMRAASKALAESDFGQEFIAEAHQSEAERLHAIPGREHPLFAQALQHLERLGPGKAGYWDRTQMEQMAGSIAFEAQRQHMPEIEELYPIRHGEALVVRWKHPDFGVLDMYAVVDTLPAMNQPLEQSLQNLAQETQRQEQQEQLAQAQAQERAQQQHRGMSR